MPAATGHQTDPTAKRSVIRETLLFTECHQANRFWHLWPIRQAAIQLL